MIEDSEFNHKRIMDAFANKVDGPIRLVSIPDGIEDGENRNDLRMLNEAISQVMNINSLEDDKITRLVADRLGTGNCCRIGNQESCLSSCFSFCVCFVC